MSYIGIELINLLNLEGFGLVKALTNDYSIDNCCPNGSRLFKDFI